LIKRRLSERGLTLGSWVTVGHPIVAEVMAQAGFDWLAIDMEHSARGISQAQALIRAIDRTECAPLVRVSSNDPVLIKRVMDAGARGVIVPMVNSREDAARAVAACYYPPEGIRGVGLARAQGYGFDFEDYRDRRSTDTVVIVQIEHIDAIRDIDEILATSGVDGSIIGPYDLSGSIGHAGELQHPRVLEAIEEYEQACKKTGVPAGYHIVAPDASAIGSYVEKGYSFIGLSLDTLLLGRLARDMLDVARKSSDQ
jgi:2-dehydro-3-deoxyglucarate aldolase